jgi:hypothetical protein
MHVGIDVPGNDPPPGGIDDDVVGSGAESRGASDGGDAAVLDSDVGARERRSARPVEERSVQKDDARKKETCQTILRGRSGFRCMVRS